MTRLARDRAVSHFSDDDVEEEIRHWLAAATRPAQRGDFANVHPAPRTPGDVPDDAEVRLIVLGSEHPHSGKTTDSPARVSAQRFLDERAAGARMHRNMLVFLAPDKTRLAELRLAVRDYLAWKSIEAEVQTLNLDNFQRKQAETKRRQFHDAVAQRLGETFIWALTPSQTTTDPTIVWEETRVSGSDPLAVRVSKKLRTEEGLITAYSGVRLRMDLDRVPLWRGDHVALKQLWHDYCQYLYLPRLRDSAVLLDAVRNGLALLTWNPDTFGYASAFDKGTSRYTGLAAGEHAAVVLDNESVLVKPDVASRQIDDDRAAKAGADSVPGATGVDPTNPATATARPGRQLIPPTKPILPTRFYGRISLEPVRLLRDIGEIADAIIQQLGRANAEITITVEIEASQPAGFGDDIRRTVTENARTLTFQTEEFEE